MKREPTLQSATWEVLPDPPHGVTDISVGDDGIIVVSASQGIFSYEAGAWNLIDSTGGYNTTVSAGDSQHIFAVVASTPVHYYKTQDGWGATQMAGVVGDISGSADGTVYAIGYSPATIYKYTSVNSYVDIALRLDTISVGGIDLIYGTFDLEESIFRIVNGEPILVGSNLKQVSVGADGAVWAVDKLGGVYQMSEDEEGVHWNIVDSAPALEKISVGNRYQVIGLTGGTIHRYQPDGYSPVSLAGLKEADYADLSMCAWFAATAYEMQPLEVQWYGSMGGQILKSLANTNWTAQNFYYDSVTSTQAFMAYTTAKDQKMIMLAFRGSQEAIDIFLDIMAYAYLDVVKGSVKVSMPVHAGWLQIRDQVIADLKAVLQKIGGQSQLKNLYVTGHSLGAALATFATYDLLASKGAVVPAQKFRMINFASPPVGNQAFVSAYNALNISSYRVLDPGDAIAWAGEVLIYYDSFAHVGKLVALPPGEGSSLAKHAIKNYYSLINQIYLKSREMSPQALQEITRSKRGEPADEGLASLSDVSDRFNSEAEEDS